MYTAQSSTPLLVKIAKKRQQARQQGVKWPAQYINKKTGKAYQPHNEQERAFIYEDSPTHLLLKGGEGAGKSVAGIVKTLNRIRRGMSGGMGSPDLEHFKKSLWPEFVNWCPVECVIPRHQHRFAPGWEPSKAFTLVFKNELGGESFLICGGMDDPASWEGPNLNFFHSDESRRHKTPEAIKVLTGRIRIPGPQGEPPQLYLTTTPRKHWLFDYFGPIKDNDPLAAFKRNSYVATVLTRENAANLEEGFATKRAESLTEAEARIVLEAEWEDETDIEKFIHIIWWDANMEQLPPLTRSEPMVLALDAATGGESSTLADCFAVVGVTRHPSRKEDVAVRYCGIYQATPGQLLDYEPIKQEIRRLCREFSVIEVTFDPTQLHDMTQTMSREGLALFKRFNQGQERLVSDKDLQNLIAGRRVAHDGNPLLRQHIDNAYVKKQGTDGLRIVKRTASLKIDATVALSMGANRCLYYNLT